MAKLNDDKCVDLLNKSRSDNRADIFSKNSDDSTCLHYAAMNGN